MKRFETLRQVKEIMIRILVCFFFVLVMWLISELVNNFAYDYFIFPFISFIVIFICGVNVGKCLERMKKAPEKENKCFEHDVTDSNKTEFHVNERVKIVTNKKILKELEDGNIVHVKTFNYNEIDNENSGDGE